MASNSKKVAKGMSSQTIITLSLGVVEIFVFSILSRLLTKEDFGYYAAISAITVVFNSLSEAGIGSAIIQRKDFTRGYRNTAFTLSLIVGLFFTLLLLATSGMFAKLIVGEELKVPLMIMSITILCHSLISVNVSQLKKQLHFMKAGLVELSAKLIASVVAIYLAYLDYGFYAIITNAVLFSILYWVFSRLAISERYTLCMEKQYVKDVVNFGGWLTASVVLRNLYHQMDKLLMSRLLNVESLGAYNRPKEFITSISAKLNGIFDTVLFPVLSGVQDNMSSMQRAFNKSLYYMNLFSISLAMSFLTNHELIIRVFLGEKWLSTTPVFIVLSMALIFNINGRLCDCYFRSLALVKYQFYIRVLQLIVMTIAVVVGSTWNITGVAIGYFIAEVSMIMFKVVFIAHRLDVTLANVISNIIKGWKVGLLIAPVSTIIYVVFPHSFAGNIFVLGVFVLWTLVLFLFLPGIIGNDYYQEVYPQLMKILKKKFVKS